MSIELAGATCSLRKLTVLAAGLGLLIVAGISKSSAEANCPQWTTPVCRAWNLGPPPTCRQWACAADKKSDPPKKALLSDPGLLQTAPTPSTGPAPTGTPAPSVAPPVILK